MDSQTSSPSRDDEKVRWIKSIPFFAVHAACLAAFFTGFHLRDVLVAVGLYYVRMVSITMGYHRYFSHRSFKTSRVFQFVLAWMSSTSVQKGVLWWSANHRHHHKESDQEADVHSPIQKGFWYSHVGWILCPKHERTRMESVRDFASYPELRWLDTWHLVPPVSLAAALLLIGGPELLVWGFFISTVLLWHGTFTINSLSHVIGGRRYKTTDTSRNNWLLALITCGEGWHNNHHYHQNTANQGWFWWELDITYGVLKVLSWLGIVWDLRTPSDAVKYAHLKYSEQDRRELRDPQPVLGAAAMARRALTTAAESLRRAAPSPQPLLKRQSP